MLGENWTRNTASFFLEKKVFEMKGYETEASAEVNGETQTLENEVYHPYNLQ